ncbi:hypothetical protein MNBD_GAMMA17-349 [hydrothermal vent metagenome]|uniref:DUF4398 domain-containing protein n=1 Tax=hydrothermal vent metagenome TaxID=652676 RepID=A0A3B0Z516_9ZZZZ
MFWVVLLAGCASAPTQEMSDARQAVSAAHDVGAAEHASENVQQAEQLLDKAARELEQGDFGDAREDAEAARVEAIKAQDIAQVMSATKLVLRNASQRGVLSNDAATLFDQARLAVDENRVHEAIRLANEARYQAEQDLNHQ